MVEAAMLLSWDKTRLQLLVFDFHILTMSLEC
jgi:hypothetical protein